MIVGLLDAALVVRTILYPFIQSIMHQSFRYVDLSSHLSKLSAAPILLGLSQGKGHDWILWGKPQMQIS